MSTTLMNDLDSRLDAVAEDARGRVEAFQTEAETTRQEVAGRIVALAREKLERLKERIQFEVKPSEVQNEHFYYRSVTLDVKTELAGVVKLGFKLTHDSDVRLI